MSPVAPSPSAPITDPDHIPVLLSEVIEGLNPKDGGLYVDGTFGAGGYTAALLQAADCVVWAIDRDPEALERGKVLADYYPGRLHFIHGRFGDLAKLLIENDVRAVDGIALDLGISSMQVDDRSRGFSFLRDGPLDMRMEKSGMSAADAINTLPESELADIIYKYGEERFSRRIAQAIVMARKSHPFSRTIHLADTIRAEVKRSQDGIDPATRTFQALRIYVNDELSELERGLSGAEQLLSEHGRMAVVSFHSLEDRIVKSFIRDRSGRAPNPSRHVPAPTAGKPTATFSQVNGRAITPSKREVRDNTRARSARLRIAERTALPPLSLIKGGGA
ncbi:MAG: 16S rRNA (cytosine(1402)-N(4))-methyltransferase RsmH [Rhodospirillaceae bacterium]|nr:16S rRNA (cytosine(1402)-N(4))-methyltransferase RsmH [Rhodospirillaceae bacterium]